MTEQNVDGVSEDVRLVIDYFRNRASELEMQNVELQLQIMKLQKALSASEDAADTKED